MLTQEELPAEPESGFAGSSTVVSISMTRIGSGTGLLCISLMHDLDSSYVVGFLAYRIGSYVLLDCARA